MDSENNLDIVIQYLFYKLLIKYNNRQRTI